ncbi:hypothetical protein Q7P37_006935 [Cladosporium fusiforme]
MGTDTERASTFEPNAIINPSDWTGENDPDNPRNFSRTTRIYSTVAVTILAFVTTLAASIYSPGIDFVSTEFNVSQSVAVLPMSLYNLGLAAGPLLGSPLSETYGRKIVLIVTTPGFMVFTIGAAVAGDVVSLNVCRFFAGMCAAPAVGNASASICDYTSGAKRAISMAFYYAVPTFGSSLGPLVGGFVVQARGWRWTQWVVLICAAACYIPILFTRETYKKTILQRRARKAGLPGPAEEKRTWTQQARYFATTLFIRPVHMLFTEPIVGLVCLYNGFIFGVLYTFIIALPWVYEHYYNFTSTGINLTYLGLVMGTILVPCPLILIDHYFYQPRLREFRSHNPPDIQYAPEHRLYPAMLGSLGLPVSLFIFAWTVRPPIHWICPIIFQGLIMLFNLMVYAPANLYMIDSYGPLYGASAAGAAMLSRYTFSAAFPLFALQLYKALGVGWATSILGFCALALAPVPFLFFRYGEKLRSRSRYERSL